MVVKKLFQDVSLGEIFYINTKSINPGNTPNKKFWHYSIPAYDDNKEPTLDRGADIKSNKYLLETDSILVSKLNPRIKRVWKFQKSDRHEPSICSTEFMVYQPKIPNVDLEYYTQFFSSDIFQNKLLSLQNGTTGSRMRVTPSDTLSIPIPFPSINEQRKIAAILSSVDEAIEKTEAIIEQTEKVKKGLMQQLLTKGIGHTKFKKTEIGEIPEEWEVKQLDSIFDFYGGMPFSRSALGEEGVFYLHYGDIHKTDKRVFNIYSDSKWLPRLDIDKREIKEYSLLNTGDIVFVDASEDTEGIGKSVVIINDEKKLFVSGLHTIIAKEKKPILDLGYKQYCFSNPFVRKQFVRIATGATVYGISKTNIKQIKIPVPPLEEQKKIGDILQSIETKIHREKEKLNPLIEIKQGLMQILLAGKVRVKVDDEVVSS